MELELVVSLNHWLIKPNISTTVYDPAVTTAWQQTMEDIVALRQACHPMLLIAPNPLTSLADVLSDAERIKYRNNVEYSVRCLHPGNGQDKERLVMAMESIEFECGGLWCVVHEQPLPIAPDFIWKTLKAIHESNHFLSLSGIDVELLACIGDGEQLLWLNSGSDISIDTLVTLLNSREWKVSVKHDTDT